MFISNLLSLTSGVVNIYFIGHTSILLAVFYFVIGLLAFMSKDSRSIGKAILLSAGYYTIIWRKVCSLFHFNFIR
jgi:hypothetical protein